MKTRTTYQHSFATATTWLKTSPSKHLCAAIILSILGCITACSNPATNPQKAPSTSPVDTTILLPSNASTDSATMEKDALTKIYTQAIGEFIKAVYSKQKTTFDTLYFGKHVYGQSDDFPDIELPTTIEHTQIRLVSPEVGQQIQSTRKSTVYINMMGWVDRKDAEFMFVVFSNGMQHQYDYSIHLNFTPATNHFEASKIEFKEY